MTKTQLTVKVLVSVAVAALILAGATGQPDRDAWEAVAQFVCSRMAL